VAEDALQIVEYENYDIVLMDILIKGNMDGIVTTFNIQQKKKIPIIFVSGNSDYVNDKRMEAINPRYFIPKPIGDFILFNTILKALSGYM